VRPPLLARIHFRDPSPACSDTLSLHDALPISASRVRPPRQMRPRAIPYSLASSSASRPLRPMPSPWKAYNNGISVPYPSPGRRRSEEHTSELQSRENLVCRLLLEKKKLSRLP